jgi:hypothetical protein
MVGSNARCISAADQNSDGLIDLALLLDDRICLLTQNTSGTFDAPQYLPAQWAYALVQGDVTGDGQVDFVYSVATNQPDSVIGVYSAAAATVYPAYDYAEPILVVDVDGDGLNDVVTAHSGYESLTVFHQAPDGTLAPWVSYPIPYCNNYQPQGIASGDLNSDGLPDIVLADPWNGLVVLLHTDSADSMPPVCRAEISGTIGQNGWLRSPGSVMLEAQDNDGGSGIEGIYYTTDGVSWVEYSGSIAVAKEGATKISFYAEDIAGNRSEVEPVEIKVDTQAPVVALSSSVASIWPPSGGIVKVAFEITGTDEASGIANLHLKVVDEYGLIQPEMDVSPGTVSVAFVASRNDGDPDGRVYTVILTGTDKAGNSASVQTTITVPRGNPKEPPGKEKEKKAKARG